MQTIYSRARLDALVETQRRKTVVLQLFEAGGTFSVKEAAQATGLKEVGLRKTLDGLTRQGLLDVLKIERKGGGQKSLYAKHGVLIRHRIHRIADDIPPPKHVEHNIPKQWDLHSHFFGRYHDITF